MKVYFLPAGTAYPDIDGVEGPEHSYGDAHYIVFDNGDMIGMALFGTREEEVEEFKETLGEGKKWTEQELRDGPFILSGYKFDDLSDVLEWVFDASPADQS
jgi:hypothetical protein